MYFIIIINISAAEVVMVV